MNTIVVKMPGQQAVDPKVQAVFDAMLNLMGNEYSSVNAYSNRDAGGINIGITCSDFQNNRWQYSEYQASARVTVNPMGASLGPGQQQQFTASAANPDGSPIAGASFTWSVQGLGTIDAAGLYSAPPTIATSSTDNVRCTLADGSAWATVAVTLQPMTLTGR